MAAPQGEDHMAGTAKPGKPPDEMRISCKLQALRPHKPISTYFVGVARPSGGRPPGACRLHARVRRRAAQKVTAVV